MKDHFTLLLLAIVLLPFAVTAQTLPNPSFENWQSSGSPPPFNWEDPADWSSTNRVTEFVSAGVMRTADAHTGDSAVLIAPTNAPGQRTALVNGEPEFNFVNTTMDAITGGTPISSMPKYLSGFYKYMPDETGGDTAYVEVILKKYNTTTGMRDTVAYGKKLFAAINAYTAFEVKIEEKMAGMTADSIVVHFVNLTHAGTGPPPTGKLYIDDLALSNVSGIATSRRKIEPRISPVPASDFIRIGELSSTGKVNVTLLSLDGKEILNEEINGKNSQLNVSAIPVGIYLLRVTSSEAVVEQKVLVQR